MPCILCIETGTDSCSVGLARLSRGEGAPEARFGEESRAGEARSGKGERTGEARLAALRESSGERDHAARVALFTQEVLAEAGIGADDLSAVAVSKGPGSYTGLRIGVSFAKGLCYGLGIPLIGVGSLDSLCETAIMDRAAIGSAVAPGEKPAVLIPMIDARRMEVYGQVFSSDGTALSAPEAWIIDEGSLARWRESDVCIFGSGAEKCRAALPWARYIDVQPSARGMAGLAARAYAAQAFENVAYFEPFYLKDFVITTSKKKIF